MSSQQASYFKFEFFRLSVKNNKRPNFYSTILRVGNTETYMTKNHISIFWWMFSELSSSVSVYKIFSPQKLSSSKNQPKAFFLYFTQKLTNFKFFTRKFYFSTLFSQFEKFCVLVNLHEKNLLLSSTFWIPFFYTLNIFFNKKSNEKYCKRFPLNFSNFPQSRNFTNSSQKYYEKNSIYSHDLCQFVWYPEISVQCPENRIRP